MAVFLSKLIRKEEVAEGTMAFYMDKPQDISYISGQHATFRIISPSENDEEGDSRTFSFITIPTDNEIGIATRMRDTAFKRILRNAEPGFEIEIKDPRGSLILPSDTKRPLVLLAGGIGITPLISMVREATFKKSDQKITLFYSNRTIKQTAFLNELKETVNKNPNFSFVPVMTQEDLANWNGEIGHLTVETLRKYIPNTNDTLFYLAGPTGMVTAMTNILTSAGVDSLFVKSEDYGEYK
ncbi:MAG: FAD-dependent oxidoreductase [Patescibacteria group bacterium]|nr:FAD-dependent oxidoreductase [Patescibacteria group bacterium]